MSVVPPGYREAAAWNTQSEGENEPFSQRTNILRLLAEVREEIPKIRSEVENIDNSDGRFDRAITSFRNAESKIRDNTEKIAKIVWSQVAVFPYSPVQHLPEIVPRKQYSAELTQERNSARTEQEFSEGTFYRPSCKSRTRKLSIDEQILLDPRNDVNREVVSQKYAVELPSMNPKRRDQEFNGSLILGPTTLPLSSVARKPAENRNTSELKALSDKVNNNGMLNLVDIGTIPTTASMTLSSCPLRKVPVKLHPLNERSELRGLSPMHEHSNITCAKLDLTTLVQEKHTESRIGTGSTTSTSFAPIVRADKNTERMGLQPVPTPVCPPNSCMISVLAPDEPYVLVIQDGRMCQTKAYEAYKEQHILSWEAIRPVLDQLQRLLATYAVPVAQVNGDATSQLAATWKTNGKGKIPIEQLLSVLSNCDEVKQLVDDPSRRFMGSAGKIVAATKVQAALRCFISRKRYLQHKHEKWAASVIALSWIMCVKMTRTRQQLQRARKEQLAFFRRKAAELKDNWSSLTAKRAVAIHIPSLGTQQVCLCNRTYFLRVCFSTNCGLEYKITLPFPNHDRLHNYVSDMLRKKEFLNA